MGTFKGAIKRKLGLKGKTKPGEMISRMNAIKNGLKLPKAGSASGVGRIEKAAMAKKKVMTTGNRLVSQTGAKTTLTSRPEYQFPKGGSFSTRTSLSTPNKLKRRR